MLVGTLVRLKWSCKETPRPDRKKYKEAWLVLEDRTMICAIDPKNEYSFGTIIVLMDGKPRKVNLAELEII